MKNLSSKYIKCNLILMFFEHTFFISALFLIIPICPSDINFEKDTTINYLLSIMLFSIYQSISFIRRRDKYKYEILNKVAVFSGFIYALEQVRIYC